MKILNIIKTKIVFSLLIFSIQEMSVISKVKLFFYNYWLPLRKRISSNKSFDILLIFKDKNKKKVYLFLSDASDMAVFNEVFLMKEYEVSLPCNPKVIFDLGSNIGIPIIYFKLKYPDVKIFAFEPDPETFKKLHRNIEQFDEVNALNTAVSNKNGEIDFYPVTNSSMSSSLTQRYSSQVSLEVKCKTLDSILYENDIVRIDLLKFDIEGGELDAFKDFQKISIIQKFIGELHLDLINGTKNDFVSIFSNFNVELDQISKDRFIFKADKK